MRRGNCGNYVWGMSKDQPYAGLYSPGSKTARDNKVHAVGAALSNGGRKAVCGKWGRFITPVLRYELFSEVPTDARCERCY